MFNRHTNVDAATNALALLNALEGPLGRKVTLFVTGSKPDVDAGYSEQDGTALPLIAAVARHEVAGHEMDTVFDGRFLSAADQAEIGKLVEAGLVSEHAWLSHERAPFTSNLAPEDAVKTLLSSVKAGVSPLTKETIGAFVQMLQSH